MIAMKLQDLENSKDYRSEEELNVLTKDFEMKIPIVSKGRELYEKRDKLLKEIKAIEASPDFIPAERCQSHQHFTSSFSVNFIQPKKYKPKM